MYSVEHYNNNFLRFIRAKHEKPGMLRKVSDQILDRAPQPLKGYLEEGKKFIQRRH